MTKKQFFLVFFVPTFLILFFLAFYPLSNAIYLSLHNWDLRSPAPMRFIGLQNYQRMFADSRFINSLKISLTWLGITLGGSILLGVILAPIIKEYTKGKFRSFCLFLFIIPAVLPRIGAAYMWRLMYSPSIGVINYFLNFIGIGPIAFLANPSFAIFSVAIIDIWQWGFLVAALTMILLEDVPRETIEAGLMEGANKWQLYRYIIFPTIIPVFLPILFIKMMESLRSFDFIFVLTAGGPGIATETLDMYAYWQGIGTAGRVSYASSMSIIMLLITIVLMSIIWKVLAKWRD